MSIMGDNSQALPYGLTSSQDDSVLALPFGSFVTDSNPLSYQISR